MAPVRDNGHLRCAACGAPFESATANQCAFCGSLHRRPTLATTTAPKVPLGTSSAYVTDWMGSATKRMVLGYAMTAAIVAGVAGFSSWQSHRLVTQATEAASSAVRRTSTRSPRAEPDNGIGTALKELPRAQGGYDLLTTLRDSSPSEHQHALGLFDGKSHQLVWRAGAFRREADRGAIAADDTNVYVLDDPNVSAIRLRDGALLWQASIATGFSSSCEGCVRALKGRLLVVENDGTLEAFDAANGRVAWSKKLADRPRRLLLAGERVVVGSAPAGRDQRVTLDFLDPSDGHVVKSVQPSCINKAFHRPEYTNNVSPLLFEPDGGTVYAMFGFFSHCVQAWDVETGQRRWSTYISGWDSNSPPILGSDAVWFTENGHASIGLDKATGAIRTLEAEKDYRVVPLFAPGKILVVKAAPEWDSGRVALWGLEPTSGKRLWQFQITSKSPSFRGVFGSWFVRPTPAGLMVLQQLEDEQLSIERLNETTGVSHDRQVIAGTTNRRPLWRDDIAWISVRGGVDAISLPSGVTYHLH